MGERNRDGQYKLFRYLYGVAISLLVSFFPTQLVNQGPVSYAGGGIVKDVKNKAVLCKPLTMTKATYCKPHMQSKPLQTGRLSHTDCLSIGLVCVFVKDTD